jgi:hypothetical protein
MSRPSSVSSHFIHSKAPPLIGSIISSKKSATCADRVLICMNKWRRRWLCIDLPSRFFIHPTDKTIIDGADPTGGDRLVPLLSDKFTSIIVQLEQLETR